MTLFVLTGAGISAESGLGTFRDKDGTGLWARFDRHRAIQPRQPDTSYSDASAAGTFQPLF